LVNFGQPLLCGLYGLPLICNTSMISHSSTAATSY